MMWKHFHEENYGRKTIETDKGFVVFEIYEDNSAYIHIMYIKPEYRNKKIGSHLMDQITKEYGVKCFTCYVDLTSKEPEKALVPILLNGFKIDKVFSDKIVLYRKV